ncbi:MAG TPA: hypothetical protein VHF89_06695 [Solirubrobacteraceae bacterium]|nr:hypothetical protein [Solirubrobacteraceae bacterium]
MSTVQQVPREGLIAIAVQNVFLPALVLVGIAAVLGLATKNIELTAGRVHTAVRMAVGLALITAFIRGGGYFLLAIGVSVGIAVSVTALTLKTEPESGARKRIVPVLCAIAVVSTIAVSLCRSIDEPVKLDTVVAWSGDGDSLAEGYLIGEDSDSVYVASPGTEATQGRELLILPRDEVDLLAVARRPDSEGPRAAICGLVDVAVSCD